MSRDTPYHYIIVESYFESGSGLHGPIHVRPIEGQDPYLPSMRVEGNHELENDYPVGTKFRIKAKITDKQGGRPFVYTHYKWPYVVLKK